MKMPSKDTFGRFSAASGNAYEHVADALKALRHPDLKKGPIALWSLMQSIEPNAHACTSLLRYLQASQQHHSRFAIFDATHEFSGYRAFALLPNNPQKEESSTDPDWLMASVIAVRVDAEGTKAEFLIGTHAFEWEPW